jgi:8-oxo-dGTP pyrophosphatase MutT (NUDIX family)
MRKIIGTTLFYFLWPFIWFYSPLRVRVRVIIRFENEILVVKNWFGPNSWQLPGGGKKIGETSIQTAVREVYEELNIEKNDKTKLVSEKVTDVRFYGLPFRYQYVLMDLKIKPNIELSDEIYEYSWINISKYKLPEEISSNL